jgi:hypothetical protein
MGVRKGSAGAQALSTSASRLNASSSSTLPTPSAKLTTDERKLFDDLVASKSPDYWRESDSHLLTRYVTLWTRAMKVAEEAATARLSTIDGKLNPIFVLEARLFRQAELTIRALGLTAFQRIVNRGGGGAAAREAKRDEERARIVNKSQNNNTHLLAPQMHEAPSTKQ